MPTNIITQRIAHHKQTGCGGLLSICSAHPDVIAASVDIVKQYDEILLVESTSNQVNQFGGYTGKTPQQFIDETREKIISLGFSKEKLVFGGDHLGPNAWQNENSEQAMEKACELVRQYAASGYDKIHLDCSMSCADDPVQLDDYTVADRAAKLCKIAETERLQHKNMPPIVYVIGTEVPVPGGAYSDIQENHLQLTTPDAARKTYAIHKEIFNKHGLSNVWSRVIALVVQPGVEFNHHHIVHYQPEKARTLSTVANEMEYAIFEAHSTDYQTCDTFKILIQDHFAILKVGPALTFAYREALFALNNIIQEFYDNNAIVNLRAVIEEVMLNNPSQWQKYYHGTPAEQKALRAYSLSDRIRYYWSLPELKDAVEKIRTQFDAMPIPLGLLHQYLGNTVESCYNKQKALTSDNLIRHHIHMVIRPYLDAITEK